MDIWDLIWQPLRIVFFSLAGGLAFIFVISLILRVFKFNRLKVKKTKAVKSELIKKKSFKTSDGYDLRWFGEIKQGSDFILVGIHDIFRNRKDFDKMELWLNKTKEKTVSLVSFDQRNCGENIIDKDFHFGWTIDDLNEIVEELNSKFPTSKIVLLGEGFGSTLATFLLDNEKVHKIIACSLRLNEPYKRKIGWYFKFVWGTLFNSKTKLETRINGSDFSDDGEFIRKLEDENITRNLANVRDYYLWKKANRVSISKINENSNKTIFFISNNDFYCRTSKIAKFFAKLNTEKYKLEKIKDKRHYLMNTTNSNQIFELIIKSL